MSTPTIITKNYLADNGAFSTDSHFVTGTTSVVETTFLCGHIGLIRVRDEYTKSDTERLSMQMCPDCRNMLLERQSKTPEKYGYRGGTVVFDSWLRGWEYDEHDIPTTLYPIVEIAGAGGGHGILPDRSHAEVRFAGKARAYVTTDEEAMEKARAIIARYVEEARNGHDHLVRLRIPLARQ